jgi:hypothetical protein
MLAYTKKDVQALNEAARSRRMDAGELGKGEVIQTEQGAREFAAGDRIYFLRNERSLGVKNGSLGTVEQIRDGTLEVRLDGPGERRVRVESRDYAHLDHGYAATVHKAQGTTVDRTFVLGTDHFDRHATYVALSRHRDSAAVFYGEADFTSERDRRPAAERFQEALSRARPKTLAHDYLHRGYGLEFSLEHRPKSEDGSDPERAAELARVKEQALAQARGLRELQAQAVALAREQLRAHERALEAEREKARQKELQRQKSRDRGLEL